MTTDNANNTASPGRTPGPVGRFIRSARELVRYLSLRHACKRLAAQPPLTLDGLSDDERGDLADRNAWAIQQIAQIVLATRARVMHSQVINAVIDAVADAVAGGFLDVSDCRSGAELKRRVYVRLLVTDRAAKDEAQASSEPSKPAASKPDLGRVILETLPCVQQAGSLDGFISECVAESKTTALAEVRELKAESIDVSETAAVRLALESVADVMTRRISGDVRRIILKVMDGKYPGVFKP